MIQNEKNVPDHIKVCNCAVCGIPLIGRSMKKWYVSLTAGQRAAIPMLVACRVDGRPYCPFCAIPTRPPPSRGTKEDDTYGSGEDAIRALEDRYDGLE